METTRNKDVTDFQRQAQALMCLRAFDALCAQSKGICHLVPLKGIDLLRTLYADTLDRELHDIDLLVYPAEKAMDFIALLQAEGYRPEFAHALDAAALQTKKKVSMLAPSENLPHVDVHIALVTKKFFSMTINSFNEDALTRLQPVDEVVSELDKIDRWLFMASHLAFHFLTGDKWYRDLALLWDRMDEKEKAVLFERAKQYHFDRIVEAVLFRMQGGEPNSRFLRYVAYVTANPKRLEHGIRPARYYWEFILIGDETERRRAYRALLFPSLGNMQNIYRCHALVAVLLYLSHVLLNSIGWLVLTIHYAIYSRA